MILSSLDLGLKVPNCKIIQPKLLLNSKISITIAIKAVKEVKAEEGNNWVLCTKMKIRNPYVNKNGKIKHIYAE